MSNPEINTSNIDMLPPAEVVLDIDKIPGNHDIKPEELKYYERVYHPFKSAEITTLDDSYFKNLIGGTEPIATKNKTSLTERSVTPKTQAKSENTLSAALTTNSQLRDLLKQFFIDNADITLPELVKNIHDDVNLRIGIGFLFLKQLDQMAIVGKLPQRLVNNSAKKPDIPGYVDRGTLSSREYASLLAIAMIDGTFDSDKEALSPQFNERGDVSDGQHRVAAKMLLFSH